MHFHRVGTDLLLPAIDCFLDRAARDDMVRATRERFKHRKFAAGEIDCLSFQAHTARSGINLKRSDPHHRVSAPAVATPQRAQPCGKFAKIERLAEIIVRSEEHTSELQSLMRNSYAVLCLKKKTQLAKLTTSMHYESNRL